MRGYAVLLVLAVLIAGCTSGSEPTAVEKAAKSILPGPTAEELARTPGTIEGVVTTPAREPIAGASVTLLRERLNATTDAGGYFRFTRLATTSYLVQIVAEGYETRTVVTNAQNGTIVELNVTLTPTVVPVPRVQSRELQGYISCGAEIKVQDQNRRADCAVADPNHRDTFEFSLEPDGKLVVLELAWDPAKDPGVPRLTLHAETVGYGAMDEDLGSATGEGYARLVIPTNVLEKYYSEGGTVRANVRMAPDTTSPAVAAQTSFVVYVTTFYVEAGSAEYSVIQ